MLFLPECFSFIGRNLREVRLACLCLEGWWPLSHSLVRLLQSVDISEPLSGPTMQRYRQLAARHGLWLSLGGFQEQGTCMHMLPPLLVLKALASGATQPLLLHEL